MKFLYYGQNRDSNFIIKDMDKSFSKFDLTVNLPNVESGADGIKRFIHVNIFRIKFELRFVKNLDHLTIIRLFLQCQFRIIKLLQRSY